MRVMGETVDPKPRLDAEAGDAQRAGRLGEDHGSGQEVSMRLPGGFFEQT